MRGKGQNIFTAGIKLWVDHFSTLYCSVLVLRVSDMKVWCNSSRSSAGLFSSNDLQDFYVYSRFSALWIGYLQGDGGGLASHFLSFLYWDLVSFIWEKFLAISFQILFLPHFLTLTLLVLELHIIKTFVQLPLDALFFIFHALFSICIPVLVISV